MMKAETERLNVSIRTLTRKEHCFEAHLKKEIKNEAQERQENTKSVTDRMAELASHIGKLLVVPATRMNERHA